MKYIALLLIVLTLGCTGLQKAQLATPENAVRYYFESWDSQDFEGMYNAISDGFKEIEPTASSLGEFTKLVKTTQVTSVTIHMLNVTSNNGERATVDFSVTYDINGTDAPAQSDLTLRYRPNDKIPGWKIVQPYGGNSDDK